jgi:hypothetical protein
MSVSGSLATLFKRLTQGVAHGEARNAFTAAWIVQVSFDVGLEHQSAPFVLSTAEAGWGVQRERCYLLRGEHP